MADKLSEEEIRRIAKQGAREALAECGLADEHAGDDIRDLRNWLETFRSIQRAFTQTTARVFTVAFWLIVLAGVLSWLNKNLGSKIWGE